MTENLCVGIVYLQTAEQCHQRVLLGRGARVSGSAVGIKAALVADAYRMGIVTSGMGTSHLLRATTVYFAILRNIVVIADGLETTCQMTGFQVFDGEILCDSRCRAVNHNKVYSSHDN